MNRELQGRVRERVRNGTLPAEIEARTYGGQTSGATCAVCDERIPPHSMVIEVVLTTEPSRSLCMHPACHTAWLTTVREMRRLNGDRP